MRTESEAAAPSGRIVHAQASEMAMERLSGRVLFPTTTQGPWLPLITFRETTAAAPWVPDLHGHAGEEVVNYVIEGELVRASQDGTRSSIPQSGISVEASREEQQHDIFPASEQPTRWLSVVVHLPHRFPVPGNSFRLGGPVPPDPLEGGVLARRLLGTGAPVPTISGLELLDLLFDRPGSLRIPVPPGRRSVAYIAEGQGTLLGRSSRVGDGTLTDEIREIGIEGGPGLRVLLASVPTLLE